MPVPWLRLIDLALGVTNLPRRGPSRAERAEEAGRDARRLELEREQREAERLRVERVLRLEQMRQAGEREIGRIRLVAGVAVAAWLGTLLFFARWSGGGPGVRVAVGVGWALLLAALASSFFALANVARALDRIDDPLAARSDVDSGFSGAIAPWLLVAGLAVIAAAVLIA